MVPQILQQLKMYLLSVLPSAKYLILMQMQPRLSESAANENRIYFSSDRIKNVCGYLNSPTSLVYPQHLANAPRTALNYLLIPPACVAGPHQGSCGRLLQSCNRIVRCLKHFWQGACSEGEKRRLPPPALPTSPATPSLRRDGKEEHTQPWSPSVAASASVAEPEMFKCACL